MLHSKIATKRTSQASKKTSKGSAPSVDIRFTVALEEGIAHQVQKYAQANESSISKAIAALVRTGLEGQEQRKREFFKKLRANLANDDASQEDQLVDEFRDLILGR
jgi:hypothetical protein